MQDAMESPPLNKGIHEQEENYKVKPRIDLGWGRWRGGGAGGRGIVHLSPNSRHFLKGREKKSHPHRISSANSADEFVFNIPGTKCRVNVYPGI